MKSWPSIFFWPFDFVFNFRRLILGHIRTLESVLCFVVKTDIPVTSDRCSPKLFDCVFSARNMIVFQDIWLYYFLMPGSPKSLFLLVEVQVGSSMESLLILIWWCHFWVFLPDDKLARLLFLHFLPQVWNCTTVLGCRMSFNVVLCCFDIQAHDYFKLTGCILCTDELSRKEKCFFLGNNFKKIRDNHSFGLIVCPSSIHQFDKCTLPACWIGLITANLIRMIALKTFLCWK